MFPRHLNKYNIIYVICPREYIVYMYFNVMSCFPWEYILLFEILYSIPEFLKYPSSNCVLNGI